MHLPSKLIALLSRAWPRAVGMCLCALVVLLAVSGLATSARGQGASAVEPTPTVVPTATPALPPRSPLAVRIAPRALHRDLLLAAVLDLIKDKFGVDRPARLGRFSVPRRTPQVFGEQACGGG